jgi:radical SAM protein with 4Fe4S-binding SPASM domain
MECPHIPEIPYREFSERLHIQGVNLRLPLGASMEVTARCNLRCAHCYINRLAGDREAQKWELSFKEWSRLLDEMAGEGCLWLLLTGGEPLLRPDFRDIYRYAKKRGMIVTLFTNGTLITPELADFLQDWPPFAVEISVYGRTKATFEAVTRVPGSYEKCLRGIDLLLARQMPLALKTTVMTLNAHELWDLKAWAEGLGVRFRYDPEINARLDGGQEPVALRLSPEEVVEFDLRDEARLQDWQRYWERFGRPPDSDYLYTCAAGIASFHLDSYGQMQICMLSRTLSYDLLRGSFRQGWLEFIPRLRQQKPQGDYPCGRCALIKLCDQCPGWASLESGDPETPVTYLCRITHLRAEILGIVPQ